MAGNIINAEILEEEILFEKIRVIQGKNKILSEYSSYLNDESKLSGTADWLFFPESEAEIISLLSFSQKNKIRISISGARTGIVGACVPSSGSILSMENMNKILGLGFDNKKDKYFLRVEPGITLKGLNEMLLRKQFDNIKELTPNVKKNITESNESIIQLITP